MAPKNLPRLALICLSICLDCLIGTIAAEDLAQVTRKMPQPLIPELAVELVAAEPDIVTPIGCRFDSHGRLFVIESHTHFPPDNYPGPPHDIIKILDDTNADGRLDRIRIFHQGTRKTMGIAIDAEDRIYLITRDAIHRIRDTDGDDRADSEEVLVRLVTNADYPHNGLGGITFDGQGGILFGLGENFGAPYELIGADGSRLTGGGEGGNVFRCTIDGGQLHWIATGLWNPFGLCFDSQGRLLAVENDPDAMPPCRIVQIMQCGDYGFQFRFGRAGTHPLLSWNGEFPGTLPMAAGTGEAPCAILPHNNQLWVTSWGDNRIELYQPQPTLASFTSQTQVVLQGDASFRPVDLTRAPDGSLYLTDWVDRSYSVHRTGRIWRLTLNQPQPTAAPQQPAATDLLPNTVPTNQSIPDDQVKRSQLLDQHLQELCHNDPFVWQRALAQLHFLTAHRQLNWESLSHPAQRLAFLAMWRWDDLTRRNALSADERIEWIGSGLQDVDTRVRLFAIRWAAERRVTLVVEQLRELLDSPSLSQTEFKAIIAALSFINTGKAEGGSRDSGTDQLLLDLVKQQNIGNPPNDRLRDFALQVLGPTHPQLSSALLFDWTTSESTSLAQTALQHLVARAENDPEALPLLLQRINDSAMPDSLRADAMVALTRSPMQHRPLLKQLAALPNANAVTTTAQRILDRLEVVSHSTESLLSEEFRKNVLSTDGDADAGWRVFFSAQARCALCHQHTGRGTNVGPDLTEVGSGLTAERLLDSLLHPSREIAPMYVPWSVLTTDGRVLNGLKINGGGIGDKQRYLATDGTFFDIDLNEIDVQQPSAKSIMPDDVLLPLSEQEVRDLLTFLRNAATNSNKHATSPNTN